MMMGNAIATEHAKLYLDWIIRGNEYGQVGLQTISWGIHKIEAEDTEEVVNVTIQLSRPGLLIGKRGETITLVTNELSKMMEKPCKIFIKEYDPFNVDYNVMREWDKIKYPELFTDKETDTASDLDEGYSELHDN